MAGSAVGWTGKPHPGCEKRTHSRFGTGFRCRSSVRMHRRRRTMCSCRRISPCSSTFRRTRHTCRRSSEVDLRDLNASQTTGSTQLSGRQMSRSNLTAYMSTRTNSVSEGAAAPQMLQQTPRYTAAFAVPKRRKWHDDATNTLRDTRELCGGPTEETKRTAHGVAFRCLVLGANFARRADAEHVVCRVAAGSRARVDARSTAALVERRGTCVSAQQLGCALSASRSGLQSPAPALLEGCYALALFHAVRALRMFGSVCNRDGSGPLLSTASCCARWGTATVDPDGTECALCSTNFWNGARECANTSTHVSMSRQAVISICPLADEGLTAAAVLGVAVVVHALIARRAGPAELAVRSLVEET